MSLPVLQLDNIDFDELTEFARSLIPRFSPQWTDHNIHDPGMTLLDLLCWLVDQQIYELGFVSDRHILAFGALLGVHPQLALPSRGLIWPLHTAPPSGVGPQINYQLEHGAKVSSAEAPDLEFALRRGLFVSSARPVTPRPSANGAIYPAQHDRKEPVVIDRAGKPLTLSFDRLLVTPEDNPTAPLSLGVELDASVTLDDPRSEPLGALVLDYLIDAPGETWRRLSIINDETQALNTNGVILFDVPPAPPGMPPDTPSMLRIVIDSRLNPLSPRLRNIALNVLPVAQIEQVASAPFAAPSNGLPDQVYELDMTGLLNESDIDISVNADRWERIDSLEFAVPSDKCYELRRDQNAIVFGNGINGAIPPVGGQINYADFVVTAGTTGNVTAGFKWTVTGAALPTAGTRAPGHHHQRSAGRCSRGTSGFVGGPRGSNGALRPSAAVY